MSSRIDPREYDLVARLAFAPIYPYLARRITEKFGIIKGVCIDIGSGPGSLAIEMARLTNLRVYSLDINPKMTSIARKNVAKAGLARRITALTADVCSMPFGDDSVDLAISRGSIPFWADRIAALREVRRVLRPSGAAYLGGGFGSDEIRDSVMKAFSTDKRLAAVRERFVRGVKRMKLQPEELKADLAKAGIPGTVELENCGIWAQFVKHGT